MKKTRRRRKTANPTLTHKGESEKKKDASAIPGL